MNMRQHEASKTPADQESETLSGQKAIKHFINPAVNFQVAMNT